MGEARERYDPRLSEWQNYIIALLHDWYDPAEVAQKIGKDRNSVYSVIYEAKRRLGVKTMHEMMRATKDTLGYA